MKEKLRQIFHSLSNGKLSQNDVLEYIRKLKSENQNKITDIMLSKPIWEFKRIEELSLEQKLEYTDRYILISQLPNIELNQLKKLTSNDKCLSLHTALHENIAQGYMEIALNCFEIVQKILVSKHQDKVLLQFVIPNKQEESLLTGLSGLFKTAALENPLLTFQIILAKPDITTEELAIDLQKNQASLDDTIVKYENNTRYVLKLEEIKTHQEKALNTFKNQGVYLITGGFGGLGILFTKEILKQASKAKVILTGRSELSEDKRTIIDELSKDQKNIEYRKVDIADLNQVSQLIASIIKENKQLNGIIHSAGMISDDFIIRKNVTDFKRVLEPKVIGTYNLDRASKDIDLDFMVLFSSIASVLGNVGQVDYASANGFMDQFANFRNQLAAQGQRYGKTLCVNWPLWQEGGMRLDIAAAERFQKTLGIKPLETAAGIEAFYYAIQTQRGQLIVMEGDLAKMRNIFLVDKSNKPEQPFAQSTSLHKNQPSLARENPTDILEKTQEYIKKQISGLLRIPYNKIDSQAQLENYGIDSILAMSLTDQLEKTFGSLPKTLFFEYQTISSLSEYFIKSFPDTLATLFSQADNNKNQPSSTITTTEIISQSQEKQITRGRLSRLRKAISPSDTKVKERNLINADPIVVVGLSGRYPEAIDIEEYWNNLRQGKDCITEVPKERWDWREYYSEDRSKSGNHFSKWGGFISGVDEFDPRFFKISPREAEFMDPQERLFLQHTWMAVEDAGYTRSSLQIPYGKDISGQVGVYVGLMYSEYQLFGNEAYMNGNPIGIAGSHASIANRVSYVLNLHGPSMTLDTMCSSSLTAIHLACQDLKLGRTSLAIAGGVNVTIHPNKYLFLSNGQFISRDGHCQSFGEGGDGYIPGEGVGVAVLKRLSDAIKDGNHIYGIIKSSALNHGGKTNGYSVPNPQAQTSAILRALKESDTNPRHISYIEAHGTGTKLGDPIEIASMTKAFNEYTQETGFCLIGSAKSNIGHCESAAGMAGLTKVLLQLKYKQIVPSLHSSRLNPFIDFAKTPFTVNQTLRSWDQPVVGNSVLPRIAGLSSFGAGGSNAHIIIQEYVPTAEVNHTVIVNTRNIIPLSARTIEQLKQKARDLLEFIKRKQIEDVNALNKATDLAAMAYTLQVGREALDERIGFIVSSVDQLIDRLQAYVNGEQNIEDTFQGQVKSNKDALELFTSDVEIQNTIEKWIVDKKLSKLLELWVKGLELDWKKIHGEIHPPLISLPTYPFAKERYWIDTKASKRVGAAEKTATILHPLLHVNTSDLKQLSYSSTFSGEESFIKDYKIGNQKLLPNSALIEMALLAVEKEISSQKEPKHMSIYNIVWAEPVVIKDNKKVSIALFSENKDQVSYEIYSEDTEETVYCQGTVTLNNQAAPQKLNIELIKAKMKQVENDAGSIYQGFTNMGIDYGPTFKGIKKIYKGDTDLLVQLSLPQFIDTTQSDYKLHLSIIDSAFQAASYMIGNMFNNSIQSVFPFSLEYLQMFSPCYNDMFAFVRLKQDYISSGTDAKIDIDICDDQGNISVQIRGLTYQQELENEIKKGMAQTKTLAISESDQLPTKYLQQEKVSFTITPLDAFSQVALKKPAELSLNILSNLNIEKLDRVSSDKIRINLTESDLTPRIQKENEIIADLVNINDHGNGIISIQIASAENKNILTPQLITQLLLALDKVKSIPTIKVLILRGTKYSFLCGGRVHYNEAIEKQLYNAIATFPYPIIADMQGDATGAGFLLGTLCDFMVCSIEGNYYYTTPQEGIFPSPQEDLLFKERFGNAIATDFLYLTESSTGKQLYEKGWSSPICQKEQVESFVQTLASKLAQKSQNALQLLKQHLAINIIELTKELTKVDPLIIKDCPIDTKDIITSPSQYIELKNYKQKILIIKIRIAKKKEGFKAFVQDLENIFNQINKNSQYRSIVFVSEYPEFFPKAEADSIDKDVVDLIERILDLKIPIIGVLNSNVKGIPWIITQFFDTAIYHDKGTYSAADDLIYPELTRQAASIFSDRFENYLGKEILITKKEYSGFELQQRVKTLLIANQEKTMSTALELAELWAKLPLDALLSWKKHTISNIRKRIEKQPAWLEFKDEIVKSLDEKPIPVSLKSKVISATAYPQGILEVRMEDQEAKNMFSDNLVKGITEIFELINNTPAYKVIILTGYDHYFASGGTKETLQSIQEGKIKFTDTRVYQLAMSCKIPVIAAMQGHGIGAGWSMGMFADIILFSEESKYVSPYMDYGFTPGAGATFIFPEKIGYDLARETLLTGQQYSGRELKEKGLLIPVIPREQVYPTAMVLATQIAKCKRNELIALKHQFAFDIQKLEVTYQHELAMHEKTFVGKSETLKQINDNFYQTGNIVVSEGDSRLNQEVNKVESDINILTKIKSNLKKYLAQELYMQEQEIDENTQFVDLGLDSITGVSWIRKINEKYNTSIEATKIYSSPTITQLSQFVKEEAEKVGSSDKIHEQNTDSISINIQRNNGPIASQSSDNDVLLAVTANIKKLLSQELHLEENEIDENAQFVDLGLDSITGVTWIRKINEKYNTSIEATKVYSYPTLTLMSNHVKEEAIKLGSLKNKSENIHETKPVNFKSIPNKMLGFQLFTRKLPSWRNRKISRLKSEESFKYHSEPIAVIGMAGQFPQAKDLEEFWQNISQGKNCISEIPEKRWSLETYFQEGNAVTGKTNCKWMGSLEEYDLFDPLFFNISPTEAECMDPQQRLFLQACWNSIENAGYNAKALSGSKCGVFVGCAAGDYHQVSRNHQLSAQGFTGAAPSILAARISYFLNLQGPSLSIDTACSSSLVAIASACESLISGSSNIALAGGVCVLSGPSLHIMSSQTGMLSRDGRCYSFDQRANGFVPGEGVGVVMLKRLSDAQKDHDIIYGVIQGWGINQDGKTNGITAPNPESQTRLEQEVYDKYQIDPANIQLIETHGTGTKLGDPIEVEALKKSFKKYTDKKNYCAIGSVKSNIGHCLTAAGAAGIIKLLLALKYKKLPPTINFNQLNEHISLKDSPFFINDRLQDWNLKELTKRQAAISAFGFGGTNAHLVLTEYVLPIEAKQSVSVIMQNSKVIIPLSARTAEQLKRKALDLLSFINKKDQSIDLVEIAYTLQVGREQMGERLGLMVSSINQLTQKLTAFINEENDIEDVYLGQVKRNIESMSIISQDDEMKGIIIEKWIVQRKLSKILELWVKGLEIDWNRLYGEVKPHRISLPTYPFAKERYWIDVQNSLGSNTVGNQDKGQHLNKMHPLLHRNTSDLSQICYTSTFSGEEFFLKDHQINGKKVLSPLSYLELIRAALEHAVPIQEESTFVEIENVFWEHPFIVSKEKDITIALFSDNNEQIGFEVYSSVSDNEESIQEIIHCYGNATFVNKRTSEEIGIEKLKTQMTTGNLEIPSLYRVLADMGICYGKTLQGLDMVLQGTNQLLAKINISDINKNDTADYDLHPCLLDGVLQTCIALTRQKQSIKNPLQPVALDTVTIMSTCTDEMYAWVRYSDEITQSNNLTKLDIDLCDKNGNLCVIMKGLELSYYNDPNIVPETNHFYSLIENSWDKLSYLSRWEEQNDSYNNIFVEHKNVLIVCCGNSFGFEKTIFDHYQQNRGDQTHLIRIGNETKEISKGEWICGIDDSEGFSTCLQRIENLDALYFLAMSETQSDSISSINISDAQKKIEVQLLRLVKCLRHSEKSGEKIETFILTCDSHSVNQFQNNFIGGGVTGLGYSLAQGNHQFFVRNIEISAEELMRTQDHKSILTAIQKEPSSNRGEVFKIQSGKRYRQKFYKLVWDKAGPSIIKQNGVYIIAGGSGTVGQIFTRNLIQKYEANVVWIGRSDESSETIQKALQSLERYREKVQYIQADLTNLNSMQKAIELIKKNNSKINGAIFSAMITDYENSIDQIAETEFVTSINVKTQGCWNFYSVLEKESLDFMCYFSSGQAYSFTGAAKVCAYATGITFNDSIVKFLQQKSAFPIGIINWGFWKKSVQKLEGTSAENLGALDDQEGYECFERFIHELQKGRISQVLCMKVTRQVESLMNCSQKEMISINKGEDSYSVTPIISTENSKKENTIPDQIKIVKKTINQVQTSASGLNQTPSIDKFIRNNILNCLSDISKISVDTLDSDTAFSDYGIDSILGVKFIDKISSLLSISLNTAVIFDHSSINRLTKYVMAVYGKQIESQLNNQIESSLELEKESQKEIPENIQPKNRNIVHDRSLTARSKTSGGYISKKESSRMSEIAIIGISGKFPKAEDVNEFWENLIQGVDGIEELPPHYLDLNKYYSPVKQKGKTRCKWGGILGERDCFDPLFFKISPVEAESMNPHQRLVLQEGWKAIEDAGYNPKALSGSQTGIFIGSEPTGYFGKTFTGLSDAIIASRLSYYLNLNGPAFVVNTGCSSSAVAIHLACESLRNKETDLALAGGVNACMNDNTQVRLDEIEMISPTGRCRTFDIEGDGTIISEGIGIVVLKRLEDAIASEDMIYGVICGSGINQDGASNGITAPNGDAQEQLITNVYNRFRINPEEITYVEAHGTGTKLGDPIEANALVRAFRKFTKKQNYCSVGSAKSYIGHTSAAAAVTGLIKTLLSMEHNRIPRLLNFKVMNPLIEFKDSPFYINTEISEWNSKNNIPRMAALNSFGHSGTNAHLVIKEYIPSIRERQQFITHTNGTVIIPLSAKTIEQLHQKAVDLLKYILGSENQPNMPIEKVDLLAIGYTLQVGREAMEERVGFAVNSLRQLAEKLRAFINGEKNVENMYQGTAKRKNESISIINQDDDMRSLVDKWIAHNKHPKILELWVKGFDFDWNTLYNGAKPHRVHLPTYPFAKERYWIAKTGEEQTMETVKKSKNVKSLEDIIDKIDSDLINTDQAVQMITSLT